MEGKNIDKKITKMSLTVVLSLLFFFLFIKFFVLFGEQQVGVSRTQFLFNPMAKGKIKIILLWCGVKRKQKRVSKSYLGMYADVYVTKTLYEVISGGVCSSKSYETNYSVSNKYLRASRKTQNFRVRPNFPNASSSS